MKILITGGKSALALKLLKAFGAHQIILADYGEVPSFSSAAYQLISLGVKNEDTLAHTLLNNCLDEAVDAILPIHSFEIEAVVKAKILFNEFNIEVLLPNNEQVHQYLDVEINSKENWVVYKAGEIIFTTTLSEILAVYGKREKLNGAFYFAISDTTVVLKLITI